MPRLSHLTSCIPTKSNLYLADSLATVVREPDLYMLLTFHLPGPVPRHMYPFRNKASFYGEELLALRPTPKLEDHTLSSVRDCLLNILQLPTILEALPPSATCGRSMPCDRDPLTMGQGAHLKST